MRTARHTPADVSPVGAAANLALDVNSPAFGVQEAHHYGEAAVAVFPGTPNPRDGYLSTSTAPGLGVDLDEREAAKHPPSKFAFDAWAVQVRGMDGGLMSP